VKPHPNPPRKGGLKKEIAYQKSPLPGEIINTIIVFKGVNEGFAV